MNYLNSFYSSAPSKIGIRPAAHVSMPHSVEVSNYWDNGGLGSHYGGNALLSGLGEFYERKHFFTEVESSAECSLSKSLTSKEAASFAYAFWQMQSGAASIDQILDHQFSMIQTVRSENFEICSIPSICISISGSNHKDDAYMPLRDTCGCSAHTNLELALFDSLRETVERQLLLRFWLTSIANKRLYGEKIIEHINNSPAKSMYKAFLRKGKVTAIDISHESLPGTAILTIFGATPPAAVQFCAGIGYCSTVSGSIEKSLIELWQTYRFMEKYQANDLSLHEIDDPYLKHFLNQNVEDTFIEISDLIEQPISSSKAALNLGNLLSGISELGLDGYFYIRKTREHLGDVYYTKFVSPKMFMHMNNSAHINKENKFSSLFSHSAKSNRTTRMVPFP
jgi:ribosomal protein S12 methylthiotransferase accessory factor YcaO